MDDILNTPIPRDLIERALADSYTANSEEMELGPDDQVGLLRVLVREDCPRTEQALAEMGYIWATLKDSSCVLYARQDATLALTTAARLEASKQGLTEPPLTICQHVQLARLYGCSEPYCDDLMEHLVGSLSVLGLKPQGLIPSLPETYLVHWATPEDLAETLAGRFMANHQALAESWLRDDSQQDGDMYYGVLIDAEALAYSDLYENAVSLHDHIIGFLAADPRAAWHLPDFLTEQGYDTDMIYLPHLTEEERMPGSFKAQAKPSIFTHVDPEVDSQYKAQFDHVLNLISKYATNAGIHGWQDGQGKAFWEVYPVEPDVAVKVVNKLLGKTYSTVDEFETGARYQRARSYLAVVQDIPAAPWKATQPAATPAKAGVAPGDAVSGRHQRFFKAT